MKEKEEDVYKMLTMGCVGSPLSPASPHIQAGKLKALAVTEAMVLFKQLNFCERRGS